jgi:Leucine-rich repeat (LRR) protein
MFRRWKPRPRYRLRTLLVVITAVCVLLAALPFEARQYQQRKARMRSLIVALGGSVDTCGYSDEPSPGANWISSMLGYVEPRESQWHVNLAGKSVDLEDLRRLRGCGWILRLDLSSTNTGDAAMSHVASLQNLLELRLRNTRVTDKGLLELKPLAQLLILDVADTAASYVSLAELERVMFRANLQEQLAISRVRAAGVVVDLGSPELRNSYRTTMIRSSQSIMASIQADLTEFGLQPDAAGAINLPAKHLTSADDEDLRRLVSAKSLTASGTLFSVKGLEFISKLTKLESVSIEEDETGNLRDNDLRWLAELPQLKKLELHSPNLTDAGIAQFARAPNLASLTLGGSGFTNNLFAAFREAHSLESITVNGNKLTPELVANLRGLRGLRQIELNLWYRGEGGEPEATLHESTESKELRWIRGRPPREVIDATSASLEHLTAIPNLRHLTLRGNLMVADALAPISRLPDLEWLRVDGRYVSHDEARKIQVAMPHCHVQRLDLE